MMDDTNRMPYWPAALNHKMAAAYCGISGETFKKICPVKPMQFTESKRGERFLRQRLDEWLMSIDPNEQHAPAKRKFGERINRQEHASEAQGSPLQEWLASEKETRVGLGGYPISDDPDGPLSEYYSKLGFDPKTMNEEDMSRLHQIADAKWRASIPGTKLGKREVAALKTLGSFGVGNKVPETELKGCGHDTLERLEARGFISRTQLLSEDKARAGYSRQEISLLEAGHAALGQLS